MGDQEKVLFRNQVPAGIKIWAEKKGHSLLVITGTTTQSGKKKEKKSGIDIGTLYLGNVGGQQLMKQMRCMRRSSNIYIRMMTNGLLSAN